MAISCASSARDGRVLASRNGASAAASEVSHIIAHRHLPRELRSCFPVMDIDVANIAAVLVIFQNADACARIAIDGEVLKRTGMDAAIDLHHDRCSGIRANPFD